LRKLQLTSGGKKSTDGGETTTVGGEMSTVSGRNVLVAKHPMGETSWGRNVQVTKCPGRNVQWRGKTSRGVKRQGGETSINHPFHMDQQSATSEVEKRLQALVPL